MHLATPQRADIVVLVHGLAAHRLMMKPLQIADKEDSFVKKLPTPEGIEIGILAAQFDRVVTVDSTRLGTERDHRVIPSGHDSMLFRRDVAYHVADFLRKGSFAANADAIQDSRESSRSGDVPLLLPAMTVDEDA